ncbi:sulfatase-like hydrolase/transferase [Actomonas aquatica]|uniref:Sulfatase-like hydrolase/transferase n=1 Tax=Actomonas aquatica TaxID=2866162 RepID=A0ABZ1C986_9BACT|nr:sulfatase-like hydrolase/transferase [Opitutus sp. WL0086]WRQ87862.1 sulfatase-like hydrolase/transferase [Opitutus sp. WL0086]
MPLLRLIALCCALAPLLATAASTTTAADRPNILWLTSEDHGPDMGCYGDDYATTPHVDALASRGLRYDHAWSNAPVCAPARTTLISGLYPPSTGTQHMRSFAPAPAGKAPYPTFLREAGYYCTNNEKTDYNLSTPADLWDESSRSAHWRNRADPSQPFFAIFNAFQSHESQLRKRPHEAIHDPAHAPVPPYHPNAPAVRQDWAQYYDSVTAADAAAGARLAELAADGLTEDTIIFYYSDHGAGMPGHKRNPNNRGQQIALVVYIPEKFAHLRSADYTPGGATDRLVSFVDFAPTLLSLIGIKPPEWMQGHAFLGEHLTPAPEFMFGFRGRMDERTDFVRTVTDGHYVYVRNFRPDLPAGQHVAYQFQTPTTRLWFEQWQAGELNAAQAAFWEPTPPEELYDLHTDPLEIHNLANDPAHVATKDRLSSALFQHLIATRDLGFLPEGEIKCRAGDTSPYDWARESGHYDVHRLATVAGRATLGPPLPTAVVERQLQDNDSAVRYWTLRHLGLQHPSVAYDHVPHLRNMLDDPSPEVAIAAAELLVHRGNRNDRALALEHLGAFADPTHDHFAAVSALQVIDQLGPIASPLHPLLKTYPRESTDLPHPRYGGYVDRLLEHILAGNETEQPE